MKILLTGPFGNVGLSTLEELLKRGYLIRIFDVKNSKNRQLARRYKGKVEIFWGDLRNSSDVEKAIKGCDTIIHLAAIIPPLADKKPKLAEAVNVGGTINIIKAMEAAVTRDMTIIALTGKDGGEMAGLLGEHDVEIRIPSHRTARIHEVHMVTLHCLCDLIDQVLFPALEE